MSQTSLDTYGWGLCHLVEIPSDNSASSLWSHTYKPFKRVENHGGMRRILAYRYGQYQSVFSSRICSGFGMTFTSVLDRFFLEKSPWISLCQSSVLPAAACLWLRVCSLVLKPAHLLSQRGHVWYWEHDDLGMPSSPRVPMKPSKHTTHKTEGACSPVVASEGFVRCLSWISVDGKLSGTHCIGLSNIFACFSVWFFWQFFWVWF